MFISGAKDVCKPCTSNERIRALPHKIKEQIVVFNRGMVGFLTHRLAERHNPLLSHCECIIYIFCSMKVL